VKQMLSSMAKSVDQGSQWYIVSMAWINKWQKYVGFDGPAQLDAKPGLIDNSDIIDVQSKDTKGNVYSTQLIELSVQQSFSNFQMKKNMQEGTDYMLVDENIYSFWKNTYGSMDNELKRFGIIDESGESKVELFWKTFNMYAIPNTTLFKLDDPKKAKLTNPVYVSKMETVADLKMKICRVLSSHLYMNLKNRSVLVSEVKLWKSKYDDPTKLREIDKKYTNYTSVEIEAEILTQDDSTRLHELDFEDTDILIVETPKNKDFVFCTQSE
jgi:hypothetical protein